MRERNRKMLNDYLKFILIIVGLGVFYGFDIATINATSTTQSITRVQPELTSTVNHASISTLDSPISTYQNTVVESNNHQGLFLIILISGGLLVLSLFLAEVAIRIT